MSQHIPTIYDVMHKRLSQGYISPIKNLMHHHYDRSHANNRGHEATASRDNEVGVFNGLEGGGSELLSPGASRYMPIIYDSYHPHNQSPSSQMNSSHKYEPFTNIESSSQAYRPQPEIPTFQNISTQPSTGKFLPPPGIQMQPTSQPAYNPPPVPISQPSWQGSQPHSHNIQNQHLQLKNKYHEAVNNQRNMWEQNQALRQQNSRLRNLVHHLQARQKQIIDQHAQARKHWEDSIVRGRESALHQVGLLLERYRLELGRK